MLYWAVVQRRQIAPNWLSKNKLSNATSMMRALTRRKCKIQKKALLVSTRQWSVFMSVLISSAGKKTCPLEKLSINLKRS
jgi:hypothetical protein